MPIPFLCQACGRQLRVKDELAGKQIYCPDCKSILTVPSNYGNYQAEREPMPAENYPPSEPPRDILSDRLAESEPLRPPPAPVSRDDDEEWDEEPIVRRQTVQPKGHSGPNIGMVLGGAGMMVAAVIVFFIAAQANAWGCSKIIIVLFIAGIIMLVRGLLGLKD